MEVHRRGNDRSESWQIDRNVQGVGEGGGVGGSFRQLTVCVHYNVSTRFSTGRGWIHTTLWWYFCLTSSSTGQEDKRLVLDAAGAQLLSQHTINTNSPLMRLEINTHLPAELVKHIRPSRRGPLDGPPAPHTHT